MNIYLMTRGRVNNQVTSKSFHFDKLKDRYNIVTVVPECEAHFWKGHKIEVVPDDLQFGSIRQWVLDKFPEDSIQLHLDDDLRLYRRRMEGSVALRNAEYEDVLDLFKKLEKVTGEYAHGAISPRNGNHFIEETSREIGRATQFHFYNADIVRGEGVRWNRVEIRQDFDFVLSMLELGYPNYIDYEFAVGQQDSNSPGGCSRYRTKEAMEENAYALQKLHPKFVTVVEKKTKSNWGGGVRTDVRIKWRQAFCSRAAERKLFV